eukprot:2923579-Lingulodinium_polyedra.AAC.1
MFSSNWSSSRAAAIHCGQCIPALASSRTKSCTSGTQDTKAATTVNSFRCHSDNLVKPWVVKGPLLQVSWRKPMRLSLIHI